ncbi:MAG: phage tail sheath family protein [Symploca sp. SIO2E6]|nr:phage tail sheath family protein [Symploca sp. SIO2E6]
MPPYSSPGVYVEEVASGLAPIVGVGTSTAGFIGVDAVFTPPTGVKLCTNFSEFKKHFGDFVSPVINPKKSILAHAVYGFFKNGGTRCYVTRVRSAKFQDALDEFEAIDEIAIVAAPGCVDEAEQEAIRAHCENMGDRFAILDGKETADLSSTNLVNTLKPFNSDYAALYFPWIQVYDPASSANILVPPSGHMAGVYARVDNQRGVHKAPANETIFGALDLQYNLSKAKQDGLNPDGINCIRKLNGNIVIWGARTIGGDANGEFKYLNVRRYFNYLKESIDEGTQWVVFEPNTPELWAQIRRNITAFLTTEWRQGALFGTTPQEAFFVKCDAENNPPEIRDLGQVVTEVGVAVVKPAEFVIFQLSQWTQQ